MKISRAYLSIASVLLMLGTAAQARISHGISGILVIDTVTAVNDGSGSLPKATSLAAIFPNPFNPRTTIEIELAADGPIELAIYDVGGRLVRVMDSGVRAAGRYQATWDGQDDEGRGVPSGMYFCRLNAAMESQVRKLTRAR